ncbi:MAG TPA: hypothetical protein VGC55_12885 [Dokdonella sp.]
MRDEKLHATAEFVVEVDIKRAPADQGNSRDGRYQFAFKPDIAVVQQANTYLIYRMSASSDAKLRLSGIYTTDARYQLGIPNIAADGRSVSMLNVNTQRMLINVSLQVVDDTDGSLSHFDPQVLNDPPL